MFDDRRWRSSKEKGEAGAAEGAAEAPAVAEAGDAPAAEGGAPEAGAPEVAPAETKTEEAPAPPETTQSGMKILSSWKLMFAFQIYPDKKHGKFITGRRYFYLFRCCLLAQK